jgi:hypothetical protein
MASIFHVGDLLASGSKLSREFRHIVSALTHKTKARLAVGESDSTKLVSKGVRMATMKRMSSKISKTCGARQSGVSV